MSFEKFEGPDTPAWRAFVLTFEKVKQLNDEELRLYWKWFNKGWEAHKTTGQYSFQALYTTPHRQRTRPKGAAPHWLRCDHTENNKRCILGEGGHSVHEYEKDIE